MNIDGKTVFLKGLELVNYLRTLPAAAVSTITLRTTAGARDDASGKNGIIEINTRRVSRRGITIGINGSMAAGRNLESNGSLSLAVNTGRSEYSMLYSLFAGRRRHTYAYIPCFSSRLSRTLSNMWEVTTSSGFHSGTPTPECYV